MSSISQQDRRLLTLSIEQFELNIYLQTKAARSTGLAFQPATLQTNDIEQASAVQDPRNRDIDLSHLLSISIQGQTTHITSDELVGMPVRQFSALWTVRFGSLKACLSVVTALCVQLMLLLYTVTLDQDKTQFTYLQHLSFIGQSHRKATNCTQP